MLRDRLLDLLSTRYVLGEELPGGGMARVFVAADPVLDRAVVVKVLPPERATAVAVERFRREARLLAKLSHPHVVPVLDWGDGGGLLWFVMPRIGGEPLDVRLASGPIAASEVRRFGLELLDALSHAHAHGVVHRDIKPSNVLLHAGHAMLADLGVALLRDQDDDSLTATDQAVGTLAYMPPEQRVGRVDPRSDCWALAATLYEALTGRRWADSHGRDRWREVPTALIPPLRRALEDDPDQRWPDAASFRHALATSARTGWRAVPVLATAGLMMGVVLLGPWHSWGATGAVATAVESVDVAIVSGDGTPIRAVARHAGLMLEWLPMLRVARPGIDGRSTDPARIVVMLEARRRAGDTTIALVARRATGELLVDRELPDDPTDQVVLGRRVARVVIAELFPSHLVEFDQLLGQSAGDVLAWRSWWTGSAAFQEGRFAAAQVAFTAALRRDPTFVVASWAQLLANMWQREPFDDALDRLVTVGGALPTPIDALVLAQRERDLRARLQAFERIAGEFPDYAPARLLLANELFHRGPLVGRPLSDGVAAFLAASADLPQLDHVTTHEQVLWGSVRLGDRATAAAALRRLRHHPDRVRQQMLLLAYDARFQPTVAAVRRAALQVTAHGAVIDELARYLRFGLTLDLPAEQLWMADLVIRRTRDEDTQAAAQSARATALLMTGRPAAAMAALVAAESLASAPLSYRIQRMEWPLLLPLFGVPIDGGQVATATRAMEGMASDRESWPRAAYALSVAARAGGARTIADAWLDSLGRGAVSNALATHLLPFAEADRLASTGDVAAALRTSELILVDPPDAVAMLRGPLVRALLMFRRGQWQLQMGDTTAAMATWRWTENSDLQGWPTGAPQDGELDAALSVLMRAHRAALECGHGDRDLGRQLARRAASLLDRAEPAVAGLPILVEARQACH